MNVFLLLIIIALLVVFSIDIKQKRRMAASARQDPSTNWRVSFLMVKTKALHKKIPKSTL
jgi:hypothetical protein